MTGSVLFPVLPYDPAETADSFARRLGQMHIGRDARRLLADLGIGHREWLSGERDAVTALATKAGVDTGALMQGVFHRCQRYREFRGEAWSADFVRAEGDRVCPECLREDARAPEPWAIKGRIAWRLRAVYTCPVHGCALISSAPDGAPVEASVFSLTAAMSGPVPVSQTPSPLETCIMRRLDGIPTGAGAWLDQQTIEQAARACEMLGATFSKGLHYHHKGLTDEDWREAGAVGYEIAREGPEAVTEALGQIASMSTSTAGQAGPKAAYGRLYEWLAYTTPVVDLGPIKHLLREHILNTMIVEPDEVLLGQRVEGRRLHSVHSLSVATGLHRKRLRKIMVQSGFASNDSWDTAANRLVFPAAEAERLCRDVAGSVCLNRLPEAIGCSRTQAESVFREGVIKSIVGSDAGVGIAKLAFAQDDVTRFLSHLENLPVQAPAAGLIDVVSATKRTGRSTGEILGAVLTGIIPACRVPGPVGVNTVRFRLPDLDPLRSRPPGVRKPPG